MEGLDILEKRISALEQLILPKSEDPTVQLSSNQFQSVTDLLLLSKSMIGSALSCRSAITSILQHVSTINEFLDPWNGDNELEVETKRHYILELYPDLKETLRLISTFQNYTSYTDSTNASKVVDLSSKLEKLALTNLNVYEESQAITESVLTTLQQYSEITTTIKCLFVHLDKAVNDLEAASVPKPFTNE